MATRPVTPPASSIRQPKARPDPTPLRAAIGIGGLAAISGLVAAIFVAPAAASVTPTASPAPATPSAVSQQRAVLYVQLAPGETAPPGATVIDAQAPKPITIITRLPAPAQKTIIVRTTQSGTVLP